MNMERDRDAIRQLLAGESERTWRPPDICRALHFRGKQVKQLQGLLRELVVAGAIVELRPGVYGSWPTARAASRCGWSRTTSAWRCPATR